MTFMDKLMIIRLSESEPSQRSVSEELGINRKTIRLYWEHYLVTQQALNQDTADFSKIDALTATPTYTSTNRKPRKYSKVIGRILDELLAFDKQKVKQLELHK